MSLQVEKLEHNMAKLTIEVAAEEVEKALQAAYLKQRGKINIPGFRKGKVTRQMIEKMYGVGVFFEDAANLLINTEYPKAAQESELDIVSRPTIDIVQIEKGKSFIFTAEVAVKPEVTLGEYKGVEVEVSAADVTEEEVAAELKKEQEKNSRTIDVDDRAVADGDMVTLDFEGFVDGVAFEGGKASDYPLTIGSGAFIPGFEDQLIGANIDEEKEINVTFPEEYQMDEYAGKPALFKVKLNGINTTELPEIDDDLIKDTTEFDTIEDWKKDIKEKMETQSEATAAAQFENHLMQKLIDTAEGVIPKCMFDKRVDQLISEFERNLKQQNMSVEIYLQYTGMDMDSFRETFQERAENEVKLRLALEKIADLENLIPTEDEINDGLKEIAEFNKITVEDIKHRIDMDAYITDLKAVKAVNFVKDNAVIDNTIVEEKEPEEASED